MGFCWIDCRLQLAQSMAGSLRSRTWECLLYFVIPGQHLGTDSVLEASSLMNMIGMLAITRYSPLSISTE